MATTFSGLTGTAFTHPHTGVTLTGHDLRQYQLAVARMASCPDQRNLDRMPTAKRQAVLALQEQARRVVRGLPPVTPQAAPLDAMGLRRKAAHDRVFRNGCTSATCRYGCV